LQSIINPQVCWETLAFWQVVREENLRWGKWGTMKNYTWGWSDTQEIYAVFSIKMIMKGIGKLFAIRLLFLPAYQMLFTTAKRR
jgi:hypothetical protein